MKVHTVLVLVALAVVCLDQVHGAFGSGGDRVLLADIKTLTLYNERMTQGRRSAPVPQLKCTGGSAARQFVPQVVQCHNQGSDGYDIQWECKTDMDNAFRFGQVQVTCEGYDYSDDPYILRGSCGLEYTLDYTKEGYQQQQGGHQYYPGDSSFHDRSHQYYKSYKMGGGGLSYLIGLAVICLIIYGIYKTCLVGAAQQGAGYGGGHPSTMGFGGGSSQPPPPGFRPEFMPGPGSCGSTFTAGSTSGTHSTGGGGFWSGAASGGLLGYLLGRNNSGYNTYYQQPPPTSSWFGSGWGSGSARPASSSWFGSSHSSGSSSSGTRTASGFGGTKRR